MKLGDRFKVKGGKVHVITEMEYTATCGVTAWCIERTNAPVTCQHCLRKLDKIKAIALMAGEAK